MDKLSKIAKTVIKDSKRINEEPYRGDKLEPGYGGTYANDIPKYKSSRDTDSASNISATWNDPKVITRDINQFLMKLFQDKSQDYEIEDVINAIEQGIQEFRKITNV